MRIRFAKYAALHLSVAATCVLVASNCYAAPGVIAVSGFNDESGINSNPTANSPFQIGVTVNGQGVGEPGWDGPWVRLGGFDDRAPVSSEFVYEGDAATKLFADQVFGTAFERPWTNIVPVVRMDAYVLVRPSASMRGNAVFTTEGGEIPTRTVAYWDIASNGNIRVFNKSTNQLVNTGFSTLPNVWNKYSLILDVPSQRWSFAFNDKIANLANPLTFLIPSNFVDRLNLQANGTLISYVDYVSATSVSGDFDDNRQIDGTDFLSWQRNFGAESGALWSQGDADGDGGVRASDFAAWQAQFGVILPPATTIPEPATASLIAVAIFALSRRRGAT